MADNDKRYYWLKLKRDFFKRHDIRIIEAMPNGKDYILFYLKLLCESVDHDGNLRFSEQIPYNEEMLSTITNTNVDIVRSAIKIFSQLGMMEILDDGTYFMNEVQRMIGSAVDNDNANRQRRFRERQKMIALPERYDSVTKNNESKSIELDKEKDKDNNKKTAKRFTPPTLEEVKAYCRERNNNVDAEQFIDFYSANGWKVGKNSMKDWKASVRTWERNNLSNKKPVRKAPVPDWINDDVEDDEEERAKAIERYEQLKKASPERIEQVKAMIKK